MYSDINNHLLPTIEDTNSYIKILFWNRVFEQYLSIEVMNLFPSVALFAR